MMVDAYTHTCTRTRTHTPHPLWYPANSFCCQFIVISTERQLWSHSFTRPLITPTAFLFPFGWWTVPRNTPTRFCVPRQNYIRVHVFFTCRSEPVRVPPTERLKKNFKNQSRRIGTGVRLGSSSCRRKDRLHQSEVSYRLEHWPVQHFLLLKIFPTVIRDSGESSRHGIEIKKGKQGTGRTRQSTSNRCLDDANQTADWIRLCNGDSGWRLNRR